MQKDENRPGGAVSEGATTQYSSSNTGGAVYDFNEWDARLRRNNRPAPARGNYTPPAPPAPAGPGGDRYAATALTDECAAVAGTPEGGRNHRLNTAAFNLGQLVGSGALDRAVVESALTEAARACGLDGSEIAATIASGLTAGMTQPRAIPAATGRPLPDTDVGALDTDDAGGGGRPRYTDFSWLLTGRKPHRPTPELLRRDDGHAIFYRGKRNELYGDPEDGKTMIAEAAAAEELAAGGRVVFIDLDHNGEDETAERLLMLGAPVEAIADPGRFRHIEPDDDAHVVQIVTDCTAWAATMAIIDCAGELIPLFGGSNDSSDDYTRVMRVTAGPLETAGAAVILIDHLAKGADSRSYGAGGTMAKRRAVSGVSIKVTNRQKFRRGHGGAAELWINKDRPGGLRQHCEPGAPGKRQQCAGTFILEPEDPATGRATWTVTASEYADDDTTTVDPVVERHYAAMRTTAGQVTGATAAAIAAIANGLPADTPPTDTQKKTARRAMEKLVAAGRAELAGTGPQRWQPTT